MLLVLGVSETSVSIKDPKPNSEFWKERAKLPDLELDVYIADHAQTDGQSDVITQIL